jgi:hypothetical protein
MLNKKRKNGIRKYHSTKNRWSLHQTPPKLHQKLENSTKIQEFLQISVVIVTKYFHEAIPSLDIKPNGVK